jgi:hypothetical protein
MLNMYLGIEKWTPQLPSTTCVTVKSPPTCRCRICETQTVGKGQNALQKGTLKSYQIQKQEMYCSPVLTHTAFGLSFINGNLVQWILLLTASCVYDKAKPIPLNPPHGAHITAFSITISQSGVEGIRLAVLLSLEVYSGMLGSAETTPSSGVLVQRHH